MKLNIILVPIVQTKEAEFVFKRKIQTMKSYNKLRKDNRTLRCPDPNLEMIRYWKLHRIIDDASIFVVKSTYICWIISCMNVQMKYIKQDIEKGKNQGKAESRIQSRFHYDQMPYMGSFAYSMVAIVCFKDPKKLF